MRHDGYRAAAPLNAEPHWPEGYIRVLREAGAQERTIPYFVGWVRRFFADNPGRKRRELGRGEIEAFLSGLVARPGMTNWHVQQARESLELYYEQFRGIALEPRPDVPTTHVVVPPAPAAAKPSASETPRRPSLAAPRTVAPAGHVVDVDADHVARESYDARTGDVKAKVSYTAIPNPPLGVPGWLVRRPATVMGGAMGAWLHVRRFWPAAGWSVGACRTTGSGWASSAGPAST